VIVTTGAAVEGHAIAEYLGVVRGIGADAVVGVRCETTPFSPGGVTEGVAYGTAVKLRPP
jgi:uncharacterized protein YbjQ (UPF0145 family)